MNEVLPMAKQFAERGSYTLPDPGVLRFSDRQFRFFVEYWTSLGRVLTNDEKGRRGRRYKAPLPENDLAKVYVRVYQIWPRRLFKPAGERSDIAQFDGACPFTLDGCRREMAERLGSGLFGLYLCEEGVSGAICYADVTLHDPEFPPVVALKDLDVGHKDNRGYVQQLRDANVAIPGDEGYTSPEEKERQAMNETMTQDLVNRAIETSGEVAALREQVKSRAHEPGEGEKSAISLVSDLARTMVESSERRAQDAVKSNTMPEMIGLITTVLDKAKPDMSVFAGMMERTSKLEVMIFDLNKSAIEEAREQARFFRQMATDRPAVAAAAAAPADNPQRSLIDQIKEAKQLLDAITPAHEPRVVREAAWEKVLEKGLPTLLQLATNAVVILSQRNGGVQPVAVQPGQGAVQQPVPAAAAQQPQTVQQPVAGPGPAGRDSDEIAFLAAGFPAELIQEMRRMSDPLCQHFVGAGDGPGGEGTSGYTFAGWVLTNGVGAAESPEGRAKYELMKGAGVDGLLACVRAWPPIWSRIGGFPPDRMKRFLNEFLSFDEADAKLAG